MYFAVVPLSGKEGNDYWLVIIVIISTIIAALAAWITNLLLMRKYFPGKTRPKNTFSSFGWLSIVIHGTFFILLAGPIDGVSSNIYEVYIGFFVVSLLAIISVMFLTIRPFLRNMPELRKAFSSSQPPVMSPTPLYTAPPVRAASGAVRIFVSHSHADNVWCREFIDALKAQGCDVWYDEQGLGGGVVWQKRIVEEIQGRPVFVVVLSPDATSSQWVDEEIQLAISARRNIIPVHHRTTTIDGFLGNRQIVDVRGQSGQAAASIVANAAQQLVARS